MELKGIKCKKCGSNDIVGMIQGPHHSIYCKECGMFIKHANKNERNIIKSWVIEQFKIIKNDGSVMQVEDGKWDGITERRYKHTDILSRLDWIGTALYEIEDILKQMKDKGE